MLKVRLKRDLRKSLLRGHPWVYRQAIEEVKPVESSQMVEVLDKKGKGLGWAIYAPDSPLALRILSTAKKPPNAQEFSQRLTQAKRTRDQLNLPDTNCYRLINGEGDRLPGMICDIYGSVAVIQFDGPHCVNFWDQDWLAGWILENLTVEAVYWKPRGSDNFSGKWWGRDPSPEAQDDSVEVLENGAKYRVNILEGQKTGFFLDQRDNRNYVGQLAQGLSVLNLFSYTGGFSVAAGLGGATQVTSVDMAPKAIEACEEHWKLNQMTGDHTGVVADVFDWVQSPQGQWDMVIVDPPSLTHSEKTKMKAVQTYTELFQQSVKLTKAQGHLMLSSCSSHVSFNDFLAIIDEAMSAARVNGQILRISGQGADHPIPHACREFRYLKFVHVRLY